MSDARTLWGQVMAHAVEFEKDRVAEAQARIEELELAYQTADYQWAYELGAITRSMWQRLEATKEAREAA